VRSNTFLCFSYFFTTKELDLVAAARGMLAIQACRTMTQRTRDADSPQDAQNTPRSLPTDLGTYQTLLTTYLNKKQTKKTKNNVYTIISPPKCNTLSYPGLTVVSPGSPYGRFSWQPLGS
jgi:hypothetical protein